MRVLYRADAGSHVGTGHLFRAIRLLRELKARGPLEAVIAVAADPAALSIAESAPARVAPLAPLKNPLSTRPHLEADPLLPLLQRQEWDLLVIDMLDTPGADMAALAQSGVPIVTFDDRGPGRRHAHTIINILITEPEPAALPGGIRLLEGGPYAVLDAVYASAHGSYVRTPGPLRRAFVAMGGADAAGLTVKVARALQLVPELETVAIATGPAFPHKAELGGALAGAPWDPRVLIGLPNLLEQYLAADLCLVAGGLTMYEACCVGAPAIAVCQPIDHQVELAERLSGAGAMRTVGYGQAATLEAISSAVRSLASDVQARRAMIARGPELVDGRGTARVADALVEAAGRRTAHG